MRLMKTMYGGQREKISVCAICQTLLCDVIRQLVVCVCVCVCLGVGVGICKVEIQGENLVSLHEILMLAINMSLDFKQQSTKHIAPTGLSDRFRIFQSCQV